MSGSLLCEPPFVPADHSSAPQFKAAECTRICDKVLWQQSCGVLCRGERCEAYFCAGRPEPHGVELCDGVVVPKPGTLKAAKTCPAPDPPVGRKRGPIV